MMNKLTWDRNSFYLDGEPFRLLAGDIHYFRIHPRDWEGRLDLALDFGLNTVQTYVPWNAHEPRDGEFDFSGMLDLAAFLRLCDKKGLKVLLRPSPYICAEWELGGLPARLLVDREMILRSSDQRYLEAVARYYRRLIPEFLPYLATNGGPIIAVAIENEYGGYANDKEYLHALARMLKAGGVDVPLYTTDGNNAAMLTFGRHADDLLAVNYRGTVGKTAQALQRLRACEPEAPAFVGELWAGRSMHWGESFYHRDPADAAQAYREVLEAGGNVCFYMFSGGTNFGFMSGANYGKPYTPRADAIDRYIPHTTSYDVDALVGEDGVPSKKYFLCRDVLDDVLGRPRRPHALPEHPVQAARVSLTEAAPLFDNLEALTARSEESILPKPMEYYRQNYGLILYSTELCTERACSAPLRPSVFRDRGTLYVNGEWFATHMRDRAPRTRTDGGILEQDGSAVRIELLVENLGRINNGPMLKRERKGAEDAVLFGSIHLMGYRTRTLPLDDLSGLVWEKRRAEARKPCFLRGHFDAKAGIDSYVSTEGFGHGYVWINGFNLGRYDSVGPQKTLYLPGALLKETDNELIILDIDPDGERVCVELLDHASLEGAPDREL